eukprot:m.184702 g.184702  ORF g.184702 m.184702 type:complete len:79 (-) comp15561_c0_seq17:107-343(-)
MIYNLAWTGCKYCHSVGKFCVIMKLKNIQYNYVVTSNCVLGYGHDIASICLHCASKTWAQVSQTINSSRQHGVTTRRS